VRSIPVISSHGAPDGLGELEPGFALARMVDAARIRRIQLAHLGALLTLRRHDS